MLVGEFRNNLPSPHERGRYFRPRFLLDHRDCDAVLQLNPDNPARLSAH
jgi:hypothetical protein